MAIRSGKLYVSKEEIELIRVLDLDALYERNEEKFVEFCILINEGNRVSCQLAQKFKNRLREKLFSFPEKLRYQLVEKFRFQDRIKLFEINKLSNEFLEGIHSIDQLNESQYEAFFERMKTSGKNKVVYYLVKEPKFRDEISRLIIKDIISNSHEVHRRHLVCSWINPQIMLEFKPEILAKLPTLDSRAIQIFTRLMKSCPDKEIYEAIRKIVFEESNNFESIQEFLSLNKENQASINELILKQKKIQHESFQLITFEVVKENFSEILPKLCSTSSFEYLIKKWPESQLEIEKFFAQNSGQIVSLCRDLYVKENIRVQYPEFIKVAVEESAGWSSDILDLMKNHPDFREKALKKIQETKQKNKVRKRSSVLTSNISMINYALADRIYQKYFENNIEEYVEKSWHMFTTIQEDSVGRVIYNNMNLVEKLKEFRENEDLDLLVKQARQNLVEHCLYREIGNFARGTQFYHDHEKEIEKNIRELRKTEKVLNS